MIQEMLNPCVVGVAFGWNTIFPGTIVTEQVTTPITHSKRRIGNDIIVFHIEMRILQKRVFVVPFDLGAINASSSVVHFCQALRRLIALLSLAGIVGELSLVVFHKFFGLNEHPARPTAWVKHTTFVRFEHFHQEFYYTSWGVKLSALFALCQCKFSKKILEYMAQDIRTAGFGVSESDVPNQVDQFTQTGWVEVLTSVDLWQDTF